MRPTKQTHKVMIVKQLGKLKAVTYFLRKPNFNLKFPINVSCT